MKKIYSIIIILLIISCSSDSSSEIEDVQNQIIENIPTLIVNVGDTIFIHGQYFNPNENYVIMFSGIEGEITEITPTIIDVLVPENTSSGDITFTFNGQTTIIGSFII